MHPLLTSYLWLTASNDGYSVGFSYRKLNMTNTNYTPRIDAQLAQCSYLKFSLKIVGDSIKKLQYIGLRTLKVVK